MHCSIPSLDQTASIPFFNCLTHGHAKFENLKPLFAHDSVRDPHYAATSVVVVYVRAQFNSMPNGPTEALDDAYAWLI
jgi:hypothetical protein